MPFLRIQIVRFLDEAQPGFVAGEFTDAEGVKHTIEDKVPVICLRDLWSDSAYPQPGVAACEVSQEWRDDEERLVARITTKRPWGLISTNGETEFIVLRSEIMEESPGWST